MSKIQVERAETFACEGAKGTASNRPRILLQVLNNGTAAAKCSLRERARFRRPGETDEIVYYCTADPVNLEQKVSIKQALDATFATSKNSTDLEETIKNLKAGMNRYFLECPFQAEWVAS